MISHTEEESIEAVATAIRRLFSVVSEKQSRDLAGAVLRDLAGRGIVLGRPDEAVRTFGDSDDDRRH